MIRFFYFMNQFICLFIYLFIYLFILSFIVFREQDFSCYQTLINVKDEQAPGWSLLGGQAQLKFENHEEKLKFPFLLAQHNYEPSVQKLIDIMRTIFKSLTHLDQKGSSKSIPAADRENSSSLFCPRVGPHWEQIGFQGLDPRTGTALLLRTSNFVCVCVCVCLYVCLTLYFFLSSFFSPTLSLPTSLSLFLPIPLSFSPSSSLSILLFSFFSFLSFISTIHCTKIFLRRQSIDENARNTAGRFFFFAILNPPQGYSSSLILPYKFKLDIMLYYQYEIIMIANRAASSIIDALTFMV